MAGIKRLLALIDDYPSVVSPEMQSQGIETSLEVASREIEYIMLAFDGIEDRQTLLRILHEKKVSHLVCFRLATLRSLIPTFWDLCEFIAELKGFNIEFISVKESVKTEDSLSLFMGNLARGWKNSRSMYKSENARVSQMKAKAKGTRLGRPKTRDDDLIVKMREAGVSIREIAIKTGTSSAAVQRALKERHHDLD
jgi:DNA invertase Pin-like site-specific DNA recombinase